MNDIDPFDEMENENDRWLFIIRQIVAGAIVIGGLAWLYWFWFLVK